MPWPADPNYIALAKTQLDAPGDSPAAARVQLEQLLDAVNALRATVEQLIENGEPVLLSRLLASMPTTTGPAAFNRAGLTVPQAVAAGSGTASIDATRSNVFYVDGASATSLNVVISGGSDGQTINLRMAFSHGNTVAYTLPNNTKATGAPVPGNGRINWLCLTYVASASRWEGAWLALPA